MTPAEHYAVAEKLATQANAFQGHPSPQHVQYGVLAQVHATLATVDRPVELNTVDLLNQIETLRAALRGDDQ